MSSKSFQHTAYTTGQLEVQEGLLLVKLAHLTTNIGWFNISTSQWLKALDLACLKKLAQLIVRLVAYILFSCLCPLLLKKIILKAIWLHHHLTSSLIDTHLTLLRALVAPYTSSLYRIAQVHVLIEFPIPLTVTLLSMVWLQTSIISNPPKLV